jgi:hypothetical protein
MTKKLPKNPCRGIATFPSQIQQNQQNFKQKISQKEKRHFFFDKQNFVRD